jgi:hypothetical protein
MNPLIALFAAPAHKRFVAVFTSERWGRGGDSGVAEPE